MDNNQDRFFGELKADLRNTNAAMLELASKKAKVKDAAERGVYTNEYASEELSKFDKQLEKLRYDGESSANAIIDNRIRALEYEAALDPSKVTEDAKLLELDGLLTQADIDAIMQRNQSNPTMARLVARYADLHGMKTELPSYVLELHQNQKSTEGMRETVRVFMKWAGDPDRSEGILERLFAPFVA